jgi:DNA-dependent RNA polymerase auxiliary subunit epsilon
MKKIKLSQRKYALVSDVDYERVSQFNWYANKGYKTYYAQRKQTISPNKEKTVSMHRFILSAPLGTFIDHKNRNGLDNRRMNLRFVSGSDNQKNKVVNYEGKSSKYKGVSFDKTRKKNIWKTTIKLNRKSIWIGRFKDEKEAAQAYNIAALKYFGEFARPNKL